MLEPSRTSKFKLSALDAKTVPVQKISKELKHNVGVGGLKD